MTSSSRITTSLGIALASMAGALAPATAAPALRVERGDGSEITMKPCVVGWSDGYSGGDGTRFIYAFDREGANPTSIVTGEGGGLAAIFSDGKAFTWDAVRASDPGGVPTLREIAVSPVRSLAISDFFTMAITEDGAFHYLQSRWFGPAPAGLGLLSAVTVGDRHVVVLRQDGTVASWLETNATNVGQATVPAGLGGVTAIDAGSDHSVALKSDGTVVAWGQAPASQVPAGLSQVKQIAANATVNLALKTDGSVVPWGQYFTSFTPPAGTGPLKQIALTDTYAAGVKTDGSVALWGNAYYLDHLLPPPGLGEVTAIAISGDHLAAITPRRIELFGKVGKGIALEKSYSVRNNGDAPLSVTGIALSGVEGNDFTLNTQGMASQLAPGASTSFSIRFLPTAIARRGSLLTLTTNDPAQAELRFAVIGDGINLAPVANDLSLTLAEDSPPLEFDLPVGDPNGDAFSLYVNTYFWGTDGKELPSHLCGKVEKIGPARARYTPGKNFNGTFFFSYDASDSAQLRDTGRVTVTVTPVNDAPLLTFPPIQTVRMSAPGAGVAASAVLNVAAGDMEDGLLAPVLRVNGQIIGNDYVFPPGDTTVEATATDSNGVTTTRTFTVRVVEGPWLAVKDQGGRPLRKSGQVVAWGDNDYGQATVPAGLVDAVAVAGGFGHSLALLADGKLVAWGYNGQGQTSIPADLGEVTAISAQGALNLALRPDGTVRAWGSNSHGATQVPPDLTGVVQVEAGALFGLALKADGTVVGWGDNSNGTLSIPPGLSGVRSIAAGGTASNAVQEDGSVVRWGSFFSYSDDDDVRYPVWLSGVESLSSYSRHTLALRSDGSVVAWGSNFSGESLPPEGLVDVVSVAAGDESSVAARRDGTVVKWGHLPPAPAGWSGVEVLACGSDHVLAIRDRKERASFRMPLSYGPVQRTLKLGNDGSSNLIITGISLTGAAASDFDMEAPGLPLTLQPGQGIDLPVTFLPAAPGSREATLEIVANDSLVPVRAITMTGIWNNAAPVASPVSGLTLAEDTPGGIQITLPATDVNGDALTYQIVSGPASGSLSPVVGGKVVYTPLPNFHGNVSFTYKVNDGFADSNVATVSLAVTPVEDLPQLNLPAAPWVVQILGGTGANVDFMAGASDGEDGWLPISLTRNGVPVVSGDFFPLGDTVIEARATDSGGRTTTGSFIVRVVTGPEMVVEIPGLGELAKSTLPVGWGRASYEALAVPAAAAGAVRVVSSESRALALKADGAVVGWGSSQTTVPAGLTNIVDIAVVQSASAAVRADGTVTVWGSGASSTYAPPATATNVVAIAGGREHFLALRGDGSVVAWGVNNYQKSTVPAGLANVVAIAAGGDHSLALKADGTVVAWGGNIYGEASVPAGLTGVRSIKAGGIHSLALRQDGTVVGWGSNGSGQITVPAGLSGVKAIAAGKYHSVALTMEGQIVAWGYNEYGQLAVPPGLGLVRGIACGEQQTFVITDAPAPVDLGITMQGATTSLAATIRNDGAAMLDLSGFALTGAHAADFTVDTTATGLQLAPGESTTFIVTFSPLQNGARSATLRITGNDTGYPQVDYLLKGHGRNGSPSVSDLAGLVTLEDTPITITLPSSDPENDALVYSLRNLSPSNAGTFGPVTGNQVVFTPKANFHGSVSFVFDASDGGTTSNLGNVALEVTPVNDAPVLAYSPGTISVFSASAAGTPVYFRVPQITDAEDGLIMPLMTSNGAAVQSGSVFTPGTHTVNFTATESAGAVINGSFQIQVTVVAGSSIRLESPVATALSRPPAVVEWNQNGVSTEPPPDLRGVKQIAAGTDYAFALRNDGTLVGWGSGSAGQLAVPAHLTNATKISCGFEHAIALRSDGTVTAWGNNSSGQATVPAGLTGVIDVAAGGDFCLVRRSTGLVSGWGRSTEGQLNIPADLTAVSTVAAGAFHGMALKSNGTVVCWGQNTDGQCNVPSGLSGVIAISAGRYHSVALRSNGSVVMWGRASESQISTPPSNSNIAAISAGAYHNLARKSDGSLLAWGSYIPGFAGRIFTWNIPAGLSGVTGVAGGGSRAMVSMPNPVALGFGKVANGSTATRTVVIRNTGSTTLTISSVTKLSGAATINRSTTGMATSIPAGQSTSFTISFAPTANGAATADFRINSSDRFEPTMDIRVTGEGATAYQVWTSAAGLSGQAASTDAEPFKDGLMNYVKYAFNLNPAGPDHRTMVPGGSSGLPHISVERSGEQAFLRVEYLRRKSSGLSYQVEHATALGGFADATIAPEITNIDATWERAIVRLPVDPVAEPRGFARVRVEITTPL